MKNNFTISIDVIVNSIKSYYKGKKRSLICEELKIDVKTFDKWLDGYRKIANDMLALENENEKLRELYVNMFIINQSLIDNLNDLNAMIAK